MRIKNKYLRNCAFRAKHWNRIKSKSQPYETFDPHNGYGYRTWSYEEQVKSHFEWIEKQARDLENGTHKHYNHADADYRRCYNRSKQAKIDSVMQKINNGNYDAEIPISKRDVDWDYF